MTCAAHQSVPIGSVLENYRSIAATAASDRTKRVNDVTSSRLSDVCVRRFVESDRKKSFYG